MKLWKKFIGFEFFDSLLSYFTFMTLVLASQSFLLMTQPQHMWWLIALQDVYFIVIMVFTFLVAYDNGETKLSRVMKVIFASVLVIVILGGCLLNFRYHLMATAILFGVSFFFAKLRQCQKFKYTSDEHKFLTWLSRVFQTRVFYGISQTILVFGSFILLGIFWLNASTINIVVRWILFGIYLFLLPVLGIFEGIGEAEEQHRRAYIEDAKRRGKEPPTDW